MPSIQLKARDTALEQIDVMLPLEKLQAIYQGSLHFKWTLSRLHDKL